MQEIGVIGSGLMGSGIVQLAAQVGVQVLLAEQETAALESGVSSIERRLERLKEKGQIEEDIDLIMERVRTTTELSDFAGVDMVVEAVSE
jgi:3-hydroxyacyl-CoA dehydrogenase